MILRRALLLSLVLLTWACTTPDVACRMKADYASDVTMTSQGERLIRWRYYSDGQCLPNSYGCAKCEGDTCTVYLNGAPPKFNDVCGLAKLGHEMSHALKGQHD